MEGRDDTVRVEEVAPLVEEDATPTLRGDALAEAMAAADARNSLKIIGEAEIGGDAVDYPDAPKEGFSGPVEYYEYIAKMNAHAVEAYRQFKSNPEKYRLRDPENPDKFTVTTMHTCADGRCNPALYNDPANPYEHLNLDWQPAAGLIYFPDIEVKPSCAGIEEQLDSNPALKKQIYETLEQIYGRAIGQFLKEHSQGITSRYFIEFQSHWNKDHHPGHGCGAWDSSLANAQKETIKNAVVVEKWLKEKFQKGLFKVIRTIQDNSVAEEGEDGSDKGHIYESAFIDGTLSAEEKGDFAGLFDEVKDRFAPPRVHDKEKHIVRPYTGNPFGIDTAEHGEQGVRITNFQWANTLKGQSSMETTWNSAEVIAAHNMKLLSIIGRNKFTKANPDKPHYLHFELEQGDAKKFNNYVRLREFMKENAELQARLADGSLFLAVTEVDPETMESEQLFG